MEAVMEDHKWCWTNKVGFSASIKAPSRAPVPGYENMAKDEVIVQSLYEERIFRLRSDYL